MIKIYKKRDLLKEILPIMTQNLKFQRMHSLLKQQLNLISNFNQKSSVLDRLVSASATSTVQSREGVTPTASASTSSREVRRLNLVKQTEVTFSCSPVLASNPVEKTNGFARNSQIAEEANHQNGHEEIIEMPLKTHAVEELIELKAEQHDPASDQMIAE